MPPTFVEFGPFYLYKDREAKLKCQPEAAPKPTVRWYKGGSEIKTGARYLVESDGTLVIFKVNKQDAGQYRCCVRNFLGDASANASAYVLEVPYPPTNLKITDTCDNRTTTLSWITRASNDAPITHFLVEQESNYEPNVFRLIFNVTNPNATSIRLNLTGWATLRFRMLAVTSLGSSRPSLPTEEGVCSTSVGAPEKFPDNLRGKSNKSEELNITWTPLPKIDWNAPGLHYRLQYRRVADKPLAWEEQNITDPTVGMFIVQEPSRCELWEFRICAANDEGVGPFSAIEQSFFAPHIPKGKPENVTVGKITAQSVNVSWARVADLKEGGSDGYRIYYWSESRLNGKRHRRDVPNYASFTNVTESTSHQITVYGLNPDTNYNLAIKAFSCGGEGPASVEVSFSTMRAVSTDRPSKTVTDSATPAGSATPTGSATRQYQAFFSIVIAFGLSFGNILHHF